MKELKNEGGGLKRENGDRRTENGKWRTKTIPFCCSSGSSGILK
jgi:hypothetical protein